MFEIKGTSWCPFCQEAKELLESLSEEFSFEDLDDFPEKGLELIQEGFKTIPQIWHNGNHVGGFQELHKYLKENKIAN